MSEPIDELSGEDGLRLQQTSDRVKIRTRGYQDLLVWQRAMDLTDWIYASTRDWPAAETYGLTAQIKRAAVSIPANIAEGNGRNGRKEYVYHLGIARGSLHEVETMVLIAQRQGFLGNDETQDVLQRLQEVGRMLTGLIRSLSG